MSKLRQVTDVDLKLLRVFTEIVEQNSFTAAQAQLNVSQSVLSENLKSLELRLGMRLCERGPGGFRVLREGKEVYHAAKALFAAVDHFKNDLSEIGEGLVGDLVIALEDDILTNPASRITEAMAAFKERHGRRVRFRVEVMAGFQAVSRVADGTAHIGITVGVERAFVRGLREMPLFWEIRHLYIGRIHPLFDTPDSLITEQDIERFSYASRGHLEPHNFHIETPSMQEGDIGLGAQAHLALALSGGNVSSIPDHVAAPYVTNGQLRRARAAFTRSESQVVAVTRSKDQPIKIVTRFLEQLASSHGQQPAPSQS